MSVLGDFAKRLKKSLIDPLDADKQQAGFQFRTPQQRQVATQRQQAILNPIRNIPAQVQNWQSQNRARVQNVTVPKQYDVAGSYLDRLRRGTNQTLARIKELSNHESF